MQEAMDLVVTFPGSVQPIYIDVSIRSPHAARYSQASSSAWAAGEAAVADNRARYGEAVLPVIVGPYGRVGAETLRSPEHLAVHVGCCLRDQWAAPRLIPRWRAALERIVHVACSDIDLLSLGCAPTAHVARAAWGRATGRLFFLRQQMLSPNSAAAILQYSMGCPQHLIRAQW